jgi:hypothetical protein
MKITLRSAVFLLLATSTLTIPAQAEDVPPVVNAILKSWETQFQAKPTYEKIETDSGGNVTITNLVASAAAEGPKPGMKLTIGAITLEDVAAEADGLIDVGSATFSDTKVEVSGVDSPTFSIEMPKGSAENWYIAVANDNPTPQQAFRASMSIARKMSSGEVKVSAMGQTITSDGYKATWDGDPATGAGKFTMGIGEVIIPESALAAMDPSGELKKLGYSDLTISASGTGELTVGEGIFGMSGNVEYAVKDMGGLKMAFGASDVPTATVVEMQAAQKAGRTPDFNTLMPQLMNVSLGNLQLRFEDASITKKVLPIIAKMQGMDETAMVANAGAMMQIGLMQLKNQAFTDQVVNAVNAFLKDPKSFTVSLKPAAPVKVQQLMTLDPANPGAAIDVLGVSITAND